MDNYLRLDCADYVVGIPGAVFCGFDSFEDARATYEQAEEGGLVEIITP